MGFLGRLFVVEPACGCQSGLHLHDGPVGAFVEADESEVAASLGCGLKLFHDQGQAHACRVVIQNLFLAGGKHVESCGRTVSGCVHNSADISDRVVVFANGNGRGGFAVGIRRDADHAASAYFNESGSDILGVALAQSNLHSGPLAALG